MDQADILILCALRPEASAIAGRMAGARCVAVGDFAGHLGGFSGKETLLVRTGPGSAAASSGLAAALNAFSPRLIVNFGTAGALAGDLHPGECVVSRVSRPYDPAILSAGAESELGPASAPEIELHEHLAVQISAMPGVRLASIGSADFSVADHDARSALRAQFGFDAVDWETYSVLRGARAARIPAFSFFRFALPF